MGMPVAIVGLVFGVIGTFGCVLVSIGSCCLWRHMKRQLHALKKRVERGRPGNTYVDPNVMPLSGLEPGKASALPSPTFHALPPASGAVVVDVSRGYSAVNQLSLLPDEVRTAANLEGGVVPSEQEWQLLERYKKERVDYEEKQLRRIAELNALRQVGQVPATLRQGAQVPPGASMQGAQVSEAATLLPVAAGQGYEGKRCHAGVGPYEFPADAVRQAPGTAGAANKSPVIAGKKMGVANVSPVVAGKKMGVAVDVGENYTDVFDTLPRSQKLVPVQTRSMSDSSPIAIATYENRPCPAPSSPSSPKQVGVAPPSPGRVGMAGEVGGGGGSTRQSKRKPAKEVVEFDPSKPRKFRMTNTSVRGCDDEHPEGGGHSPSGGGDAATTPTRSRSMHAEDQRQALHTPSSSSSRPFSLHSEEPGLAYALVSMEDKRSRRMQEDSAKVEGSGTPQHIRVPIASS